MESVLDLGDCTVADELLKSAASNLKGCIRRMFLANVCLDLCSGNARRAEKRFGWGRATIAKGMEELSAHQASSGDPIESPSQNRGRQRSEEANPELAVDIRLVVEPYTQSDPELKSERVYTNLSAKEVQEALIKRGYQRKELPSERTLRDILNRMNYRLKRIQKGKPIKKTEHTDAIFENIKAVRQESAEDPEILEISIDTKTKVKLGEYSMGGKNPNRLRRQRASVARS